MLGHIIEVSDNQVIVKLEIDINKQPNLVNLHIVFDDSSNKLIIGQIVSIDQKNMIVEIIGEIINNNFTSGIISKPSFKSKVRMIKIDELELIYGTNNSFKTNFGTSNIYSNYAINISINDFFANHFAIMGNSGSGKSCTVASIIQKLFLTPTPPLNSRFFFFDAYGEYKNAFSSLNNLNSNINYKNYTTNLNDINNLIKIPIWLLDVDDIALLLDASTPLQLPIIEKCLYLVKILTGKSENVLKRKNDIIARALQDILLSGDNASKIRDQVIGVLTKFQTPTLNLETKIVQPGYTRNLKQCLFIDKSGKMQEIELVVEFVRSYILDDTININNEDINPFYTLKDLEEAMDFALISEGILKSDKVFDYANIMSVRLHTLVTSNNSLFFTYDEFIDMDEYLKRLVYDNEKKCQIINFNINYIDDRLAKVITKIISKMLFTKQAQSKKRGKNAYHLIIEEAHRYIQNDNDINLLGYNIFERISKEGRKYGIFLGMITQRPNELSDTCISQCSNFLILRTLHPKDLTYIKDMVPNVSMDIVLQLKNLKPGNVIGFGSSFKIPTSIYVDLPNPRPLSDNIDLTSVWYVDKTNRTTTGNNSNISMGGNM